MGFINLFGKGDEVLAVVVDFGAGITVSTVVQEKKLSRCLACDSLSVQLDKSMLADHNYVKEIMEFLLKKYPEMQDHLLVSYSSGSGIIYKNIVINKDMLMDFDKEASSEEKEDSVTNKIMEYLPSGLQDIYGDYIMSVITSYQEETDVTLSVAYIPKLVVLTIRDVCSELGINLINICPLEFGLFNVFDDLGKQLVVDYGQAVVGINMKGVIVWQKLSNYAYDRDMLNDFFAEEAYKVFRFVDGESINEFVESSKYAYLRDSISVEKSMPVIGAGAVGLLCEYKGTERKEGSRSVTSSIRKLFAKGGK